MAKVLETKKQSTIIRGVKTEVFLDGVKLENVISASYDSYGNSEAVVMYDPEKHKMTDDVKSQLAEQYKSSGMLTITITGIEVVHSQEEGY